MFRKTRHIHFVGIGGVGMCGIAEVLLNLGYKVSGSDVAASDNTKRLKNMGAEIFIGHQPENIKGAEVVVISSIIRADNPEVLIAREKLIPVIPRAEMLAELMRLKYGVAVAGTHGKTTTTSLIATILANSRLDPTIVIGGKLNSWNSGAKLGQGDFLVAEADESDGSFLKLYPTVAVVTTVDEEHLDFYSGLEEIKETFLKFINNIPFYGVAILCLDEENIQALLPKVKKRYITYGLNAQADYTAKNIISSGLQTRFTVYYRNKELGDISINLAGKHNVLNALAALAVGLELEIGFAEISESLKKFSGIHRRFQIKGEVEGVIVIDDYGHHPAEIMATLKAIKEVWPERRLIVVFQPHRFSRTEKLLKGFCKSFYDADYLVITEIYAAGEKPIPGVKARLIYECVRNHGHKEVHYLEHKEKIAKHLAKIKNGNDVILTLGAGDIWKVAEEFIRISGEGK